MNHCALLGVITRIYPLSETNNGTPACTAWLTVPLERPITAARPKTGVTHIAVSAYGATAERLVELPVGTRIIVEGWLVAYKEHRMEVRVRHITMLDPAGAPTGDEVSA